MARRTWRESDHPRHPGGSDQGGQFRERVGSGGWAARLNAMLGGRRGSTEYQVGRVGGRSDLGDTSADDLRQALAESDADYVRGIEPRAGTFIGNVPETHGNARPMDEGGNLPRLTSQEVADALAPTARTVEADTQAARDIEWLAGFEEGTEGEWGDSFRPNRVQELIKLGALRPIPDRPGWYTVHNATDRIRR